MGAEQINSHILCLAAMLPLLLCITAAVRQAQPQIQM
jgi:hypothetical protein